MVNNNNNNNNLCDSTRSSSQKSASGQIKEANYPGNQAAEGTWADKQHRPTVRQKHEVYGKVMMVKAKPATKTVKAYPFAALKSNI